MDKIKLYRPVYLAFSSLRDGVGYNLGIIHDCDVTVFRKAMRVIDNKEIRWQLLDEDMFYRSANENYDQRNIKIILVAFGIYFLWC